MELTTQSVAAVVALLALVAVGAIWLVPRLQARRWQRMGMEAKDVAELENSARGTLVQAFGGIALILTFIATWVQLDDTRQASERTLQLTRAQQESERFTRAVDQLGSDKLEVRLGGIYALQQAARESPRRQRPVAELMTAYIKRSHRLRPEKDYRLQIVGFFNQSIHASNTRPICESTLARPWPDTQAAAAVLVGIPPRMRGRIDLADADLVGVQLPGADFAGIELSRASLADADLRGARFDGASLRWVDLRRTCLRDADLGDANVLGVEARGSDLRGAELDGVTADGDPDWLRGAMTDDCSHVASRSPFGRQCREAS